MKSLIPALFISGVVCFACLATAAGQPNTLNCVFEGFEGLGFEYRTSTTLRLRREAGQFIPDVGYPYTIIRESEHGIVAAMGINEGNAEEQEDIRGGLLVVGKNGKAVWSHTLVYEDRGGRFQSVVTWNEGWCRLEAEAETETGQ